MNSLINNPEIIAAFVTAIGAISAAIVAVIKSFGKKVENLLGELRPNGGQSIKDQINRLDHRIDEIYRILIHKDK